MDKRQIIYRVNMALTMLKKKNKKYALNIQNMIDIISGKNESDFLYIVDDLSLFLEVFKNLSSIEQGFIFSKFMERNFMIIQSSPYSYMRDGFYTDSFLNFGISSADILPLYCDFCADEDNFHVTFSYLDHVENIISYLLTPTTAGNVYMTTLENYGTKDKAAKYYGIVKELQKAISKITKTYEDLYQAFQVNPYLIRARDTVCHITHISQEDAVVALIDYILHHNLKSFQCKKEAEFKSFLHTVKEAEEQERLRQVYFYQKLASFVQKEKRDILDYQNIIPILLEHFPVSLVNGYVLYLFEEDTMLKEKSEIVSKKTLKQELSKYYSYNENIPFDYHNFGHLLRILKQLNYSDSRVLDVFNRIVQNAIKNDAYYAYVLERCRAHHDCKTLIQEIDFYLELLCYAKTKEEWMEYHKQLIFLCQRLPLDVYSFSYEEEKLQKIKCT